MIWPKGVLMQAVTLVLITVVNGAPNGESVSKSNGDSAASCEQARIKCAYRTGCGGALTNYLEACSEVFQGVVSHCSERCQFALVALTSTDEGKTLMTCECNDELFCENTKIRLEVCRPQVINAIRNDTVPCRFAQWICAADPQCSTALEYYNRYCKSMFHGKKCTHRCQNSISILQRQEKAAKLNTCHCDGQERYPCHQIQQNMARLCFPNTVVTRVPTDIGNPDTNEVRPAFTQYAPNRSSSNSVSNFVIGLVFVKIFAFVT